jgi:hypothetical protein
MKRCYVEFVQLDETKLDGLVRWKLQWNLAVMLAAVLLTGRMLIGASRSWLEQRWRQWQRMRSEIKSRIQQKWPVDRLHIQVTLQDNQYCPSLKHTHLRLNVPHQIDSHTLLIFFRFGQCKYSCCCHLQSFFLSISNSRSIHTYISALLIPWSNIIWSEEGKTANSGLVWSQVLWEFAILFV